MRKKQIITVNASTSFASRARCKICGKPPSIYFFSRNSILWYDPNRSKNVFEFIRKHCKRLSSEEYKYVDFPHVSKISYFTHMVNYKGYKPKLHRSRGVDPVFDIIEYLTCDCGSTLWAFSEINTYSRPEICKRKAKYSTPPNLLKGYFV